MSRILESVLPGVLDKRDPRSRKALKSDRDRPRVRTCTPCFPTAVAHREAANRSTKTVRTSGARCA